MIFKKILNKIKPSDENENIITDTESDMGISDIGTEIFPETIIEERKIEEESQNNINALKYTIILYLMQIQKSPVNLGIWYSNYLDETYTPEEIEDYVIRKNFITKANDMDNLRNILPTYTVNELKEVLEKNNLPTDGNKQSLIKRLEKHLSSNELSIEFNKQSYNVSQKGLELISENPQIGLYKKYFSHHDLNEYENYYQNNKTEDMKKFSINYLKAIGDKNIMNCQWFTYKWNSLRELAYLYFDYQEYELALNYFMKLFICELSFWENSFYSINFDRIINESYTNKLIETVGLLKLDIDELKDEFYQCYDKVEVPLLIIPKGDMFQYFIEILTGIPVEKVNKEITSKISIPEELKYELYYDNNESIDELVNKIRLYDIYEY